MLSRDPLREASYRLLMRLHTRNGDRGAALHIYHSCALVLQEELGVEPDPSTRRQYEQPMDLEALAAAQLPSALKLSRRDASLMTCRNAPWAADPFTAKP